VEYCLEYLGHLQCTSPRKRTKMRVQFVKKLWCCIYLSERATPEVGVKGFDESLPLGLVA